MKIVIVRSAGEAVDPQACPAGTEIGHVHAPTFIRSSADPSGRFLDTEDVFRGADAIAFVIRAASDLGASIDKMAFLAIKYVEAHPRCRVLVFAEGEAGLWLPVRLSRNALCLHQRATWPDSADGLLELLAQAPPSDGWKNPETPLAPPEVNTPRSVFISYATEDRALVEWIERELSTVGLEVLRDVTHFQAGRPIPAEVRRCVAAADVVLVLITEKSANRGWPAEEVRTARELGIPVVPLVAGLTPLDGAVPELLGRRLYGRLTTLHDDHDREILLNAVLRLQPKRCVQKPALRTFVLGIVGDIPAEAQPGEGTELALDLCAAIFAVVESSAVSLRILLLDIDPRQGHESFTNLMDRELRERVIPAVRPGGLVVERAKPDRGDLRREGRLDECSAVISVGGLPAVWWLQRRNEIPLRWGRSVVDLLLRLFRPESLEITQVELNRAFRRHPIRRPWLPLSFCPGFSADLSRELVRSWYGPTARALSAASVARLAERRPTREALVEGLRQLIGGGSAAAFGASDDDDASDLIADRWVERGRWGLVSLLARSVWYLIGNGYGIVFALVAALVYLAAYTPEARLMGAVEGELGRLLDPNDLRDALKLTGGDALAPSGDGIRQVTQYLLHAPAARGALKILWYQMEDTSTGGERHLDVRSATASGASPPATACISSPAPSDPEARRAWTLVTADVGKEVRVNSEYPSRSEPKGSRVVLGLSVSGEFKGEVVCVVTYDGEPTVSNAFIVAPWTAAGLATEFKVVVGHVRRSGRGMSSFYPLWETGRAYRPVQLTLDRPITAVPEDGSLAGALQLHLTAVHAALVAHCPVLSACEVPGSLTPTEFDRTMKWFSPEGNVPGFVESFQFFTPMEPLIRSRDVVYLSAATRSGTEFVPRGPMDYLYVWIGQPLRRTLPRL